MKEILALIRSIDGWLSDSEAILLATLAKQVNVDGEIVEIGSYKGKSTIALAYGVSKSKKKLLVWAVDPHQGVLAEGKKSGKSTYTDFKKNVETSGLERFIRPIVATSREASNTWKQNVALLFLDGLHDYEHTKTDYRVWSRFVTYGGVIAFHDGFCGEIGVWNVISTHLFQRKDLVDIGTSGSILYAILGKPGRFSRIRVARKKKLIRVANWIYRKRVPWLIQKFGIHVAIRLLLMTKYTRHSL